MSSDPPVHLDGKIVADVHDQRLRKLLLEAIVSATPDLVYAFDLQHRFIFVNDALLAMWGLPWEDAIGKTCLEIGYEPWHAAMHGREINQAVAQRHAVRGEVPFVGTNGRRIYEYIFVPVSTEDGEVVAVAGTTRDVTERQQQEQHRTLLTNELQHRVKNTLSVVQGIARQSFGNNPEYKDFTARLSALATGMDALTKETWKAVGLRGLVDGALAIHQPAGVPRISVDGPDILVQPRSVVALSLSLGELATNAVKYGSLSNKDGVVEVSWRVTDDRFKLLWRERGGPKIQLPTRKGFGSRLITSLASELGGKVSLDYPSDGVVCEIDAGMDAVAGTNSD